MSLNKTITTIIVLVVLAGATHFITSKRALTSTPSAKQAAFDPKNATYQIEGQSVALVNGKSEMETAPGSASKIVTTYFGNEAYGDLNGDGVSDTVFLITQTTGGSGTFYYAVAALTGKGNYTVTNAFLIGDRIAPQSTEIHSGEIHINFAERKRGEPMTAQPSVGAVLLLKVTSDNKLTGLMQ
jgi:hypothetical protein